MNIVNTEILCYFRFKKQRGDKDYVQTKKAKTMETVPVHAAGAGRVRHVRSGGAD